jgi:hypothetical protein
MVLTTVSGKKKASAPKKQGVFVFELPTRKTLEANKYLNRSPKHKNCGEKQGLKATADSIADSTYMQEDSLLPQASMDGLASFSNGKEEMKGAKNREDENFETPLKRSCLVGQFDQLALANMRITAAGTFPHLEDDTNPRLRPDKDLYQGNIFIKGLITSY